MFIGVYAEGSQIRCLNQIQSQTLLLDALVPRIAVVDRGKCYVGEDYVNNRQRSCEESFAGTGEAAQRSRECPPCVASPAGEKEAFAKVGGIAHMLFQIVHSLETYS